MKRVPLLIAALLAWAWMAPSVAAESAWITRSNANAGLLLQNMAKYDPESASSLGVEGYDVAISDLSHDLYAESTAATRRVMAELQKRLASETDTRVRQDLEILIGSAKDSLSSSALDRKYFFPFVNATGLVYGVVQQTIDPRIPAARQQTLVTRLEKYAGLAPGYKPVTDLARQRTLERIKADGHLLGPYRGQVEKVISDNATLVAGIKELLAKSAVQGWEPSYAALERQLGDYNNWLKSYLLPRARADYRLPAEVYADNLHQYGVDIAPEELIAKALTSFAEIRNQMIITAGLLATERGYVDADYHAVIRKLKEQQIPADQVMSLYKERLGLLEAAVREHRVISLPDRKASIRLATAAENAQQPAPHMSPPRLIGNTGEYGEFVLSTGMSPDANGKALVFDDFTHQAATWTLTAHEARPGHELQFARMIEIGVSTARAVFAANSTNVEGWALYAEAEMQPYEPLDGQLIALEQRSLRAARAFLDPMLNLGQITPEAAKSFLMDEVDYSEGFATQEIQRYSFRAPGQATSYFYGYQRLMEARQAAQLVLRDKFDRMAFNDFVLSQGLVPPKLLRQAVMEEFVPARRAAKP
jgi:uncharacterized protein (DUF885 family)